jgi:pyruvate dehydrogenase E2 component (dihydrolipoamide acetyltransferase)
MATNVELTKMSDTMTEGTVVEWLKAEGDEVRHGDSIAEIETDKATMDLEAPRDGVLLKRFVEAGATVPCGTVLAVIGAEGEPISDAAPAASQEHGATEAARSSAEPGPRQAQPLASPLDAARLRSSPSARKLARTGGADLKAVSGSGPGGRILRRDVEAALADQKRMAAQAPSAPPAGEVVPISRLRKRMIERLVATHREAPTFSLTRRINMDAARAFRESLAVTNASAGGIGYTELLVKAAARAMKAEPGLNARFTERGIERVADVNVGIAVGLEDGVVVPVIRRCQALALHEIRDEFARIVARAKDNTLLAADLGNSTFTISNLGMYGVEQFTAVLNAPDAAILAVGAITPQPVVSAEKLSVAHLMSVTLTVDHRVADGVLAARWLQVFSRCVENPVCLVVE